MKKDAVAAGSFFSAAKVILDIKAPFRAMLYATVYAVLNLMGNSVIAPDQCWAQLASHLILQGLSSCLIRRKL